RAGNRSGLVVARRVRLDERRAAPSIEAPAAEQSVRGRDLSILAGDDLRCRARVIPDAGFVEGTVEEAGSRAGRRERDAQRRVLNAIEARDFADGEGILEHAVEIQV